MEIRKLTCISCPMGCQITVEMDGNEVVSVTGNTCKRGDVYARKEVTNKTKEDIPKGKIFDCVKALKGVEVEAPVHIGDVVMPDAAGTGVDIVATKNVERA